MDEVNEHVYLGTIISRNGQRMDEMKSRISKSKSVVNEIVQICKMPEMSQIRLLYVQLLISSCFDSKIKYGCAFWDVTKCVTVREDLDKIKPNLIKSVLELPTSTPSIAIYEFGIIDLSIDVLMEKVIVAVETLNRDENRIAKKLLEALMQKNVDGFCTELSQACSILSVELDKVLNAVNAREYLKRAVTKLQSHILLRKMMLSSKTDMALLAGFSFHGYAKKYLHRLNFEDAKIIFMSRYRMWPTKANFSERWSGTQCNICGYEDTDKHIFSCPGYIDIISQGQIQYDMFWNEKVLEDMELLKQMAKVVKLLISRMEMIQKVGEMV